MRHIPDDELHAYLDQALSRSQCVEIERHLAWCSGCRDHRDDIAALRDRTTALLARIGPPPIVPPAYSVLRVRHAKRVTLRWHRLTRAAWAAGFAGVVALGWSLGRGNRTDPAVTAPAATGVAERPSPEPPAVVASTAAPRRIERPARPAESRRLVRLAPSERATPVRFAMTTETGPEAFLAPASATAFGLGPSPMDELITQPVASEPELQGLWRTIVPDSNLASQPGDIPRVPGLPVLQMRVQPGNGGSDVTAVDQLLESGEVVRTIAGPAARVGALVVEDTAPQQAPGPESTKAIMTVTIRQGDRMVAVTGPSQALGSLLTRVDLKRRRY